MHVVVCDKCQETIAANAPFVEVSTLRMKGRAGDTQALGSRLDHFHVDCAPPGVPAEGEFVPGDPRQT